MRSISEDQEYFEKLSVVLSKYASFVVDKQRSGWNMKHVRCGVVNYHSYDAAVASSTLTRGECESSSEQLENDSFDRA